MNKSTKKYYAQGHDIEVTELDDQYWFATCKEREKENVDTRNIYYSYYGKKLISFDGKKLIAYNIDYIPNWIIGILLAFIIILIVIVMFCILIGV